jgi:molecular chaperone HscC
VERALRDAKLRAAELDAVVLVGGATRMPMVRTLAARLFGQFPTSHINPDEVVALGAAVQAALKARDASLQETVLTDVAPYTLGIETSVRGAGNDYVPGRFLPIIERNSPVPVSKVDRVYPIHDSQTVLQIEIYQGESRLVENNVKLGEMKIGVPAKGDVDRACDVRFTYDINGLLEVEARAVGTGESKRVVIEGNPGVLTPAEIEERLRALAALKIHPRETIENRTLMARAERLYEEGLGAQRERVAAAMADFERALDRQNPDEIGKARAGFKEFLDRVEKEWQM